MECYIHFTLAVPSSCCSTSRAAHAPRAGTCQQHTITVVKGLPLLGFSSRWAEPVQEGDALEREGAAFAAFVRLKGFVSIIREGEGFEEGNCGKWLRRSFINALFLHITLQNN